MKTAALCIGLVLLSAGLARAGTFPTARYLSPSGRFQVVFTTGNDTHVPFYLPKPENPPPGLSPRYLMLFYQAGSSDPVCADWYTDAAPPKQPTDIFHSFVWAPGENYVLITHGQNSKTPDTHQWIVSLTGPYEYGFQASHARWVDRARLVADLNSSTVPGGILLVDAKQRRGELIVSPHTGTGYEIASSTGPRIAVREFLNHWGDEKDKTSWESYRPACFELNLDTLKKRSILCP